MPTALVEGTRGPQMLSELAQGQLRKKIPALRETLTGRFGSQHALIVGEILAKLKSERSWDVRAVLPCLERTVYAPRLNAEPLRGRYASVDPLRSHRKRAPMRRTEGLGASGEALTTR